MFGFSHLDLFLKFNSSLIKHLKNEECFKSEILNVPSERKSASHQFLKFSFFKKPLGETSWEILCYI